MIYRRMITIVRKYYSISVTARIGLNILVVFFCHDFISRYRMIEETAQIPFQFADGTSGGNETSDLDNGNLLNVNNHKANACATAVVQSNNVISRMNSSSTMSDNQEDLFSEIQDCQVALKLTVCRNKQCV